MSFSADSDGKPKQNMANLALKGILGLRAMAEIAAAVGNDGDHSTYSVLPSFFYRHFTHVETQSKATSMISSWKSQYTSSAADRHLFATTGNSTSWSLAYNLFGDRLLGFDLVDSDASVLIIEVSTHLHFHRYIRRKTQYIQTKHRKLNLLARLDLCTTAMLLSQSRVRCNTIQRIRI